MSRLQEVGMTDQAKPVRRPSQSLRFSVRRLIVLVLVIGAGLGWLVRSAHVQREAVAAVEQAGGSVSYDWELRNGKFIRGGKPWVPRWLVNLIGVDYFGHINGVGLNSSSSATDGVLAQVGRLTQLQRLRLDLSEINDDWLAHLKGLTKLSALYLSQIQLSDTGLAHLKGLTNLSYLDISYTQVTDTGLAHLKVLTKLSGLSLSDTIVTDAGLVHLKEQKNLSSLDLTGTRITDAGIKELKQALPRLTIYR